MSDTAYLAALRMLAGRELSDQQLRRRLTRKGHDPEAVATAIARLKENRSLDDDRVAGAIARLESGVRRRGPIRVRQRLAAAGIPPDVAQRALDETFAGIDADALLASVLEKRLAAGASIADRRQFSRLYRQLVAQGFAPDRVLAALRARTTNETDAADD